MRDKYTYIKSIEVESKELDITLDFEMEASKESPKYEKLIMAIEDKGINEEYKELFCELIAEFETALLKTEDKYFLLGFQKFQELIVIDPTKAKGVI